MRTALYLTALVAAILLTGCGDQGQAKDFTLVPLDDQARSVTLADFKGKTVLIDFWATWCGPCNAAMPEVQAIWDKYHSKGLEVVAVTAEDRDVALAFSREKGHTYPVYLDPKGAMNIAYGIESIPKFMLIRGGRILWQQDGYDRDGDLSAAVDESFRKQDGLPAGKS